MRIIRISFHKNVNIVALDFYIFFTVFPNLMVLQLMHLEKEEKDRFSVTQNASISEARAGDASRIHGSRDILEECLGWWRLSGVTSYMQAK